MANVAAPQKDPSQFAYPGFRHMWRAISYSMTAIEFTIFCYLLIKMVPAASPISFDSLPNEIVISVVASFPTPSLVPLAAVDRRFQALVARILRQRLSQASRLPGHDLVLECYHPSAKTSTPYFHCRYLGTDGLDTAEAGGIDCTDPLELNGARLRSLYSRFRPVVQDEARRPRARYPRRDRWQQQQQQEGAGESARAEPEDAMRDIPSHDVHLDEGESFSQLCTLTNVGRLGPQQGLYLGHVNVSDGVIRVWREWLAARAAKPSSAADDDDDDDEHPSVLWADAGRNVGVRFHVVEIATRSSDHPVLVPADSDLMVAYRLEYRELLVRTRKLLLALEESEVAQCSASGKALILFVN